MFARWILSFALIFSLTVGISQPRPERNTGLRLKSMGLYGGTKHFKRTNDGCGIYRTSEDLQLGVLSISIDCRGEEHKIKQGFVRDKSAIKIIRRGATHSFLRSDIYGYRDCGGDEYHFYEGKSYQLVNAGESIPIYRIYEWHGKQRTVKYFFRKSFFGPMKQLTLANLKVEFSGEPSFLEKLHELAEDNIELIKYLHAINRVRMSTLHDI